MQTTIGTTAIDAVKTLRDALADAGLPRTSRYAGGELTGWTTARGCTGFSVRVLPDGDLSWHVVVSGKPHLRYREYREDDDTLHEPTNTEILHSRIRVVFEAQGLDVRSVEYGGHQTLWDDDVEYDVVTARPVWLEDAPAAKRAAHRY